MMVINNNIPALTTYGIVNNTSNALQKSIQKLSTGLRINSAADDAAGLSISEKMRAQINGLDRAVANAQDGISLIQTAEGALTETHSILHRMRELSVQAANDTLTQQDRSYIQEEVDLLRDEIDHIGNTTTFNTKKLLNGDAAVLWSSDNLNTRAIVNGGVRSIDRFGQKSSAEGNYKISVKAVSGEAQVQKTDIFKVKHLGAGTRYHLEDEVMGTVSKLEGEDLEDGVTYNLETTGQHTTAVNANSIATNVVAGKYGSDSTLLSNNASNGTFTSRAATNGSWSFALKVSKKDRELGNNGTLTHISVAIDVTGYHTDLNGNIIKIDQHINVTATTSTNWSGNIEIKDKDDTGSGLKLNNFSLGNLNTLKEGDIVVWNVRSAADTNGAGIKTSYTDPDGNKYEYTAHYNEEAIKPGGFVKMGFMELDENTGELNSRIMKIHIDEDYDVDKHTLSEKKDIGYVKNYDIGDVAQDNVRLRDLDKFWDAQGNFLLEDPQTITITQGNGKQAKVTLYGHDTLEDVQKKLNAAIADDLNQKQYLKNDEKTNKFAVFVNNRRVDTSESVEGTFVIRSIVPGSSGTLSFASKNEDVLNALSLNTIQDATESTYKVKVEDAHTGAVVVPEEQVTGNILVGRIHPNIDVEFDAMTGVKATWDKDTRKFTIKGDDEYGITYLHIADNTTVFQIGANAGDDMGIHIGDMRAHALGLDSVLVTDRASASRSITIIDNAIDKVSTQRAKLGAYQNRLEHTMTNLASSSENLSAAESRIRDTDMAKEMMNFTKLQIMLQAGTSMLTQANQLPQNVLALIR